MIPVLENLDPENADGAHHYWVLNINLRDKRFEVFDSWRMLKKSKRLDDVARAIVAAIVCCGTNTIQNKQRQWTSSRLWISMHQSRLYRKDYPTYIHTYRCYKT